MQFYGRKAWEIVGYSFQADMMCTECARKLGIAQALQAGSAYMWGDLGTAEQTLDEWAGMIGLDREDEASFDSGDFPKVVFRSMLEDTEHCGQCFEPLGE